MSKSTIQTQIANARPGALPWPDLRRMTSSSQRYRPSFDAVALSAVPSQPPTAVWPARAPNCGVWDERKVLDIWRYGLAKLAVAADDENFERRHDGGLDRRRVGWLFAFLVQRCFESRATPGVTPAVWSALRDGC